MLQTPQTTTFEHLLNQFGGALLIRPAMAASIIGMARQTLYNQIAVGTFPIPLLKTSTGRKIKVSDLANYIDSLQQIPIAKPAAPVQAGRPNRVEQASAKARGLSVREYRAQQNLALAGV